MFYGREQATAQLARMLAGRLDAPSMLVVTGPSGAGKSSLLRAGLLPYLKGGHPAGAPDGAGWPSLVMTPTADPLTELSVQLSALTGGDQPRRHQAGRRRRAGAGPPVGDPPAHRSARRDLRGR